MFSYYAIFYYLLMPKVAAYYRWTEQSWWKWGDYMESTGVDFEDVDF